MIKIDTDEILNKYLDRAGLDRFLDEAETANQKFNLFSRHSQRRDLEIMVAESLLLIENGWINQDISPILDIGSGWGIPAIPLLLSESNFEITMVERSRKKADFLLLLLRRLELSANVLSEDIDEIEIPEKFGLIIARGVAINKKIIQKLKEISKPNGALILFGSGLTEDYTLLSQALLYSIDNLPERKIIKCQF
jgi:16S rRNA (guanine527-N7)-methyltransferase